MKSLAPAFLLAITAMATPAVANHSGAVMTEAAAMPEGIQKVVAGRRAASVEIRTDVSVGRSLPGTVVLRRVPGFDDHYFAVVNDRAVLVDPLSRTVLEIIE